MERYLAKVLCLSSSVSQTDSLKCLLFFFGILNFVERFYNFSRKKNERIWKRALYCNITLLNRRDSEIKLKGVSIDDEWVLNDTAMPI